MVRNGIIGLALSLALFGCNGQTRDQQPTVETDTIQPKTDIRVNREYDQYGNLVRYDSTYSYYYSNIEGDSVMTDSIFGDFRKYFNGQYGFSEEPFFNDFFFEDSLLHYDFYKKDFFSNRFNRDMESMEQLFRQMDSVKNAFFYRQFPDNESKQQGK